ncbi:MAG: PEP-CTERM sorting domain-containing protein [Limisphaerales bacterium]
MKNLLFLSVGAAAFITQSTSAQLIESFENTLDGWQVPPSYNPQPAFGAVSGFSTTTGVTAGSYSLSITGTGGSGPNYSQILASPSSMLLTATLADAASVSFDVYTPPGSFGYYLQFDVDINNADTGFVSLDGYSYIGTAIGAETTITVPVSPSLQTALGASSNPTSMDFQVGGGYTAGNETLFIDNILATPVPEPSTLAIAGLGAAPLLLFRRRQAWK